MQWLRRLLTDRDVRRTPIAEPMEPRLLYSADLTAGLMLATSVDTAAPEVRTVTSSGEYAAATAAGTSTTAAGVQTAYAALRMGFEANQGQAAPGVDYVAQGSDYGIALAGGNAQLTLVTDQGVQSVTMTLQGGHTATAQAEDLQATTSNSILGSDPSQWRTGIANYGAVRYAGVYDGVDVRYYGTQRQLEYDFIVAAGADAGAIRLQFQGSSGATVDAEGNLVLQVAGSDGTVRFKAPVAYQRGADGQLEAVASRYALQADGSVGFALGAYDTSRELVIDPVLDYATYFGDNNFDNAVAVATDAQGNVYVTGRTNSVNSSSGPLLPVIGAGGGSGDVYVAKFSSDLSTLLWSTRIGGSNGDQGNAIAVDGNGNVAVAGWTKSNDFPTKNATQASINGGGDAFILKLNASGALVFSTYLGGSGSGDLANAVAFDGSGNVYAAGQASPAGTLSALELAVFGSSDNAFVNKYAGNGNLLWSQWVGGSSSDAATGIAVGNAGAVYVVGQTQSSNLGVLFGQQGALSGSSDGFLARLDGTDGSVGWSTYLGGSSTDSASAVALFAGKVYVVGTTHTGSGTSFATTAGAFMTSSPASNKDTGFVRVYDTTKTGAASLLYSSYLGGSGSDTPTGVAYTGGRVVVTGLAGSTDFPVTGGAVQATNAGTSMYVVVLNPAGGGSADLQYGTYYGDKMTPGGVAIYGGRAYVVAATTASGYGTAGSYQPAIANNTDGIVAAFDLFSNTAPTLGGVVQPAAILEDGGGGSGFLVSSLIAGQVSDPDAGALAGIAIVASPGSASGTWQYSLNNGSTWTAVGSTSASSALVLAADTQSRLRFVPAADYAGTASAGLTIRAWDRTSGATGSRVDASVTGGITAFSSASFGVDQAVTPVNDPPVRTGGIVVDVTTTEDKTVNLGLGGLSYGPGGGADEAGQVLTVTVTGLPTGLGDVVLSNGTTLVTLNTVYTVNDLKGMKFVPAANVSGTGVFSWKVTDDGGTANGGNDTLLESIQVTVTAVNDAPVRLGGSVSNLTVVEGSPAASLGLAGVSYGPGGGADEAGQSLSYQVTTVPTAGLGRIVLADGTTTVIAGSSYSLAQIQGMQFLAGSVASGSGTFSFSVQDNGGTANGGVDTLVQSLAITIVNQAPTLDGLNALSMLEDDVADQGMLVSSLVAGHIADPLGASGIAVTAASDPHGTWQYTLDAGTTWTSIAGVSDSQALLLASDANTRVRFVPQADWNGPAAGLSVRAWDRSAGTAGQLADTTVNGGSSPFSAQLQTASVTVTPVNDAPVIVAGSVANVTARAGTTTGLGLTDLAYGPGGGSDEAGQGLTFTVTGVPPAALGTVLLADGVTALIAGNAYTLAELQGMQFTPASGVSSGSGSFAFTVQDSGGTASGGSDTLAQSLTITVANQAPVLGGANALPDVAEDAAINDGTTVAQLVSGQITDPVGAHGIAVVAAANADGAWQFSRDDGATWSVFTGVAPATATLLTIEDRIRFVAGVNWNGTAGGLVFRAWDGSAGTAAQVTGDTTVTGGSSPYSDATAEAMVTVLPVNDAPVRSAGTVANLTVAEDSGGTSLGLGTLAYGAGGGADEAGQVLTYDVTAVPPATLGQVTLADGTAVAPGSYTLAQIQGMRFLATANANGTAAFSFQVNDGGGTANGGVDTLVQSLQITVTPVNDTPVRTAGTVADLSIAEDSASTSLGLSGLAYAPGGGADEAAQSLTYAVTTLPPAALGQVTLADGTAVGAGTYTLAQIQGMRFQAAANANGSGSFAFTVQDDGGTANGGSNSLLQALNIVVTPVNDAPVRLSGTVNDLTVVEGQPATSLGLAGLAYGPGGGTDEAGQSLAWRVTAVPAASVGRILLADGTTVVAGGSYTLAQLQGMQFAGGNVASGSGTFSFTVQDDGGTANGGSDTVSESLTIAIVNQAPTLDGLNPMTLREDPTSNDGVLVADLVNGHIADPLNMQGVAISAASDPNGSWQYSLDGGTTWTTIAGVSEQHALLLGTDASTRVRFVPAPDFAGNAGGLAVRAWDQSSGAAGGYADVSSNGGSTAFSAQVRTTDVTVTPVNDAPVLAFGGLMDLTVSEGSTTSLGLQSLSYAPGGGADEASQSLMYRVTAVPPAAFGTLQLADGTVVAAGQSYTLSDIEGLKFAVAAGVTSGSATFAMTVQDDGGTLDGGADSLSQAMLLTVRNAAPVLAGSNPLTAIAEDDASNGGTLVADLVNGQISDPGASYGIAVTAATNPNGSWQYSRDNGASWQSFSGVGTTSAVLLAADGQDRVRFVPTADWNGTAGGLVFRAWDGSGATAGATTGDTSTTGGDSPYSVQTAEATVAVLAVNDPPVRTAGTTADLTVAEDSGSTSLGLGALAYGPGGGIDEATQSLAYTVTSLPPASLGLVTLADGTAVTTGSYTLAQVQGMRFATAANANGTATFSFAVRDDGAGTDTLSQALRITVTPVNDAPRITSNGGAAAATVAILENTSAVTIVTASDVDTPPANLVFGIAGGADAARFAIDRATGALSFLQAPDYEQPADANRDNVYQVVVQVGDGSLATQQALSVRIADVNDTVTPPPAPAPAAAPAAAPSPATPPDLGPAPAPASAPAAAPSPGAEAAPQPRAAAPSAPTTKAAPAATTVHDAAGAISLQDALGPAMPTPIASFNESPPTLANAPARLALAAETSHVLRTVVLDRAGLQLIASDPNAQLVLARFGIDSQGDALRLVDLQRSLHSSAFAQQFDRLRDAVRQELHLDDTVTISAASVSLGLSLVYVVWLIRGGVLVGSYLSALPAWRLLDPLPVLSRVEDEEDEEEPLEGADVGGQHTLRGFG